MISYQVIFSGSSTYTIPFNFFNEKVGPYCVIGEGAQLGDKCSVKRSVIDRHCRIGSNVKVQLFMLISCAYFFLLRVLYFIISLADYIRSANK